MKRKNAHIHTRNARKINHSNTCNLQVVYSFAADWVVVDEGPAGVVA